VCAALFKLLPRITRALVVALGNIKTLANGHTGGLLMNNGPFSPT
jgi:hypothetical protein